MLLYILVVDHFMTHKTTGLSFASRISALRYWHLVQVRSALFFSFGGRRTKTKSYDMDTFLLSRKTLPPRFWQSWHVRYL